MIGQATNSRTVFVLQREYIGGQLNKQTYWQDSGTGFAQEDVDRLIPSVRATIEANPRFHTGAYRIILREIVTTETIVEEFEA